MLDLRALAEGVLSRRDTAGRLTNTGCPTVPPPRIGTAGHLPEDGGLPPRNAVPPYFELPAPPGHLSRPSVPPVPLGRDSGGTAGTPANHTMPADDTGPLVPCRACGCGAWWRTSAFPTGGPPGLWQCHRCDPLPPDAWADACAVPVRLFPAIRKLPAAWPDPSGSVCTPCRRVSTWRADAPAGPSPCVLTWRCTGCAARTAAPIRPGGSVA